MQYVGTSQPSCLFSHNIENRIAAASCLRTLLKDKQVQKKKMVCIAILNDCLSSQVLFRPVSSIQELLAVQLREGENSRYTLLITFTPSS